MPLAGRVFSFGNMPSSPWVLALLGILSQTVGTWLVAKLLAGWGISPWYALVYGLFAGFFARSQARPARAPGLCADCRRAPGR